MTALQRKFILGVFANIWADRSKEAVSHWCERNLRFDEPENSGPFSLAGRDYIREPLDAYADSRVSDMVLVFGSQAGKTGLMMGGNAWLCVNDPARILWVMANENQAKDFSTTRWQPMLKNSPTFEDLIPRGAKRHDFAKLTQLLGSSIVNFHGSNSPSNLASKPARVVVQDEVDKFSDGTTKEADAVNLADQRTKGQTMPKRVKSSTPTITEGLIWQEFLKTDMRRRWVPCPHCSKFVVLIWSKNYTVFPLTGDEAEVKWDKEARVDGKWDLKQVERTAHFECPHCAGQILDAHKTIMDRDGEWRPTCEAANGYRGWHLPSLYASTPETNVGKLAVKFLQASNSLMGLQGFINGDLAEPFENQDTRGQRVEIVTESIRETDDDDAPEPVRLMSVDCQAKAPFFWYVVREWIGGNSLALSAGPADTWEELEEIQRQHEVKDAAVIVDSGFGARSDAEVYRNCCLHGSIEGGYHVGWLPSKGMPGRKRWRDKQHQSQPWHMVNIDPMMGTAQSGQVNMSLFEFSGDFFKDVLEGLRQGRGDVTWGVHPEVNTDEYWRHLDGEIKTATRHGKTGSVTYQWQKRSRHWPNHMLDCEVMQIALATFFNLFAID